MADFLDEARAWAQRSLAAAVKGTSESFASDPANDVHSKRSVVSSAQIEQLEGDAQKHRREISELCCEIAAMRVRASGQLDEHKATLSELEREICSRQQHEQNIVDHQSRIAQLVSELAGERAEKRQLLLDMSASAQNDAKASASIAVAHTTIDEQRRRIHELERMCNSLRSESVAFAEKVGRLERDADERHAEVVGLGAALAAAHQSIAYAEAKAASFELEALKSAVVHITTPSGGGGIPASLAHDPMHCQSDAPTSHGLSSLHEHVTSPHQSIPLLPASADTSLVFGADGSLNETLRSIASVAVTASVRSSAQPPPAVPVHVTCTLSHTGEQHASAGSHDTALILEALQRAGMVRAVDRTTNKQVFYKLGPGRVATAPPGDVTASVPEAAVLREIAAACSAAPGSNALVVSLADPVSAEAALVRAGARLVEHVLSTGDFHEDAATLGSSLSARPPTIALSVVDVSSLHGGCGRDMLLVRKVARPSDPDREVVVPSEGPLSQQYDAPIVTATAAGGHAPHRDPLAVQVSSASDVELVVQTALRNRYLLRSDEGFRSGGALLLRISLMHAADGPASFLHVVSVCHPHSPALSELQSMLRPSCGAVGPGRHFGTLLQLVLAHAPLSRASVLLSLPDVCSQDSDRAAATCYLRFAQSLLSDRPPASLPAQAAPQPIDAVAGSERTLATPPPPPSLPAVHVRPLPGTNSFGSQPVTAPSALHPSEPPPSSRSRRGSIQSLAGASVGAAPRVFGDIDSSSAGGGNVVLRYPLDRLAEVHSAASRGGRRWSVTRSIAEAQCVEDGTYGETLPAAMTMTSDSLQAYARQGPAEDDPSAGYAHVDAPAAADVDQRDPQHRRMWRRGSSEAAPGQRSTAASPAASTAGEAPLRTAGSARAPAAQSRLQECVRPRATSAARTPSSGRLAAAAPARSGSVQRGSSVRAPTASSATRVRGRSGSASAAPQSAPAVATSSGGPGQRTSPVAPGGPGGRGHGSALLEAMALDELQRAIEQEAAALEEEQRHGPTQQRHVSGPEYGQRAIRERRDGGARADAAALVGKGEKSANAAVVDFSAAPTAGPAVRALDSVSPAPPFQPLALKQAMPDEAARNARAQPNAGDGDSDNVGGLPGDPVPAMIELLSEISAAEARRSAVISRVLRGRPGASGAPPAPPAAGAAERAISLLESMLHSADATRCGAVDAPAFEACVQRGFPSIPRPRIASMVQAMHLAALPAVDIADFATALRQLALCGACNS